MFVHFLRRVHHHLYKDPVGLLFTIRDENQKRLVYYEGSCDDKNRNLFRVMKDATRLPANARPTVASPTSGRCSPLNLTDSIYKGKHLAKIHTHLSNILNSFKLEKMMLATPWLLAVFLAVVALASPSPAINEIRQPSNKPGRFLSLPVPNKCAQLLYMFPLLEDKPGTLRDVVEPTTASFCLRDVVEPTTASFCLRDVVEPTTASFCLRDVVEPTTVEQES
uniref:Uncharacterized protein n=1 Tax=Timema bartmani TaxID=61472 RepID=A0A7R9I6U8_9NEOP|nr:unnamed protein product [Timema bartmani]